MTIRLRLTLLHGALLAGTVAVLLGISYWLMDAHLRRTLLPGAADGALAELASNYVFAFAGATLVALALGWLVAGRVLAPLRRVTHTARRVSQDRLDERIALEGPDDEVRELAGTFDAMLDRLEGSWDAQRRFVANASHELRSPLTAIRAEAEVALSDPAADAPQLREMGEAVLSLTDETDALLESLMVLARSQRGLVRREPVDLAAAARAATDDVAREASAEGVAVDADLRPARASGDERLLRRLAANLLENAVRHNRRGGRAWASTRNGGGAAILRVENTGAPLAPADVARLTEPFERGARRRDGRGAGLGLSIVRSVAEAHGGRLALAPRAGGGLVAEVALPTG